MEAHVLSLPETRVECNTFENTATKVSLEEVFKGTEYNYLNERTLFIAHFNLIPNFINARKIDCKKANKWFSETYKHEIRHHYFNMR